MNSRPLTRRLTTTDRERGDVPGWVLITLMTAMLVTALLAVARGRLVELFQQAMEGIT